MPLVEANWKPNAKQVRQFGALCLVGLPLVAWLWSAPLSIIGWLAFVGAVIAITSRLAPALIVPLYVAMMFVTLPIGIVVSELVLLGIYYLVFLPIGLIFRVIGRDRLQLRKNETAVSYWQPKARPRSVRSYFRQS